jgi:hypothetical protein
MLPQVFAGLDFEIGVMGYWSAAKKTSPPEADQPSP